MRISDWSSDVCSSDLLVGSALGVALDAHGLSSIIVDPADPDHMLAPGFDGRASAVASASGRMLDALGVGAALAGKGCEIRHIRSEEHTSELQSLMRISYAVFCLKKKNTDLKTKQPT